MIGRTVEQFGTQGFMKFFPEFGYELRSEREMCLWAISKYFGDWVSTQVLKYKSMPMDEQGANHK
jgi:hypothetical protein